MTHKNNIESKLASLGKELNKLPEQLDLNITWPESMRAAPNEWFRSGLFTARRTGQREQFKDVPVFVLGGGEITYRGEELRTHDEDVWLQVMHLVREYSLGVWVDFSPYKLIHDLGWVKRSKKTGKVLRPSKVHYERLKECLSRMQATTLIMKTERMERGHTVSLIRKFEWEGLEEWRVWVEPEMKALFGENHFTRVGWEQRSQLSPAAKKLHGYYASHKKPHPVHPEKLHKICNVRSTLKNFKQKLPAYLKELEAVGFAKCTILDSGLVKVNRGKAA